MADDRRTESVPSLTASRHWGRYAAGMATEALFVIALAAMGLLLAAIAMAVYT